MKLTVRFFAGLRDIAGQSQMLLDLTEGATAGELLSLLQKKYPKMASASPSILIAVNHEFAGPGALLHDDDEVAFLPPVSGGSDV